MKLISRTEFADIFLHEEGEKCIVKKYRLKVGEEAHFLKRLGGIHTPKLYRSDSDSITIEFIEGQDLHTYLVTPAHDTFAGKLSLIRSIAFIYSFFHDNGVLHMDPKPDNILVKRDGTLKVIDFQLSTSIENPVVHLSREYIPYYWYNIRPPESFRRDFKPSIKSEIYTLGHLFYYILKGHFLFAEFIGGHLPDSPEDKMKQTLRDFHEHVDRVKMPQDPLSQLIGGMISREEGKRPESMQKVVGVLNARASRSGAG